MAVSTFQLFAIAVLATELEAVFELSKLQLGVLGACNTAVGALMAPRLGRITDLIGARQSVIVLCGVGAAGLALTAVAPNYWVLLVASLISGLPQGWSNSATNKLIAERLPAGERGVITGFKQSGVQFAILLAGATLPTASNLLNWRAAIGSYAAISLGVGLLAARILTPDSPASTSPGDGADEHAESDRLAALAAPLPRFVYQVAVYALLLGLVGGGVGRWFQKFTEDSLGFSTERAGLVLALSGALGMFSRVIWGRIAEQVMAPRVALRVIAIGSTGTVALLAAATTLGDWTVWLIAFGMAAFLSAWNVVAMLAVITSVPPSQSGRGTGVVMLAFLGGLTIGSPAVGWSVDQTGDFQLSWYVLCAFAALGIISMLGTGTAARASSMPRDADDAGKVRPEMQE